MDFFEDNFREYEESKKKRLGEDAAKRTPHRPLLEGPVNIPVLRRDALPLGRRPSHLSVALWFPATLTPQSPGANVCQSSLWHGARERESPARTRIVPQFPANGASSTPVANGTSIAFSGFRRPTQNNPRQRMHISDIDLKLLRVFHAVVKAGGFSNAQSLLNISPSTISSHMHQLEVRIGFSLCERGRSGFSMTLKGEQFYQHVLEFFGALHSLENNVQTLRNSMVGHLSIGIIDNLVVRSIN